ncbi:hypothetical protein BsWGS_28363 [Bradybaena similaris]
MYYLMLIAAAAFAVVSCGPVDPCSDFTTKASQCLSSSGLDISDFEKLAGGGIDTEAMRKQCNQLPQYLQAYQCVSSEFDKCSDEGVTMPTVEQMSQMMNLFCNDSSLRYDCITQVQQQNAQVQSCVMSQYGSTNQESQPAENTLCEASKISVKCVVDLVAKCDAHTGNVVAQMAKITTSHFCDGKTTQ